MHFQTETRGVEVHRVVHPSQAPTGEVRAEAEPPFRGGLRVVPDGDNAREILPRGRQGQDRLQEVAELVVLGKGRRVRGQDQDRGRRGCPCHRLRRQEEDQGNHA